MIKSLNLNYINSYLVHQINIFILNKDLDTTLKSDEIRQNRKGSIRHRALPAPRMETPGSHSIQVARGYLMDKTMQGGISYERRARHSTYRVVHQPALPYICIRTSVRLWFIRAWIVGPAWAASIMC